jgi:hypothetical protein
MRNEPGVEVSRGATSVHGGRVHDVQERSVWPDFQRKLAETLGVLEEDQYLVVSAKRGWAYVQFVGQGSFGMRAECVSNNYLDEAHALSPDKIAALERLGWSAPTGAPEEVRVGKNGGSPNFHRDFERPVPFDDAARMAVRALMEVFEISHPGCLKYKAFDRSGPRILVPTLGLKRELPPSPREKTELPLRTRVLAATRNATGNAEIAYDVDGDLQLRFGSALVIVRLLEDPPCIRIYSPLLVEVEAGSELLERLNELNARVRHARLLEVDGTVYAAEELYASPFVEELLKEACWGLGKFAEEIGVELQRQFGGRTAFEEFRGHQTVQ